MVNPGSACYGVSDGGKERWRDEGEMEYERLRVTVRDRRPFHVGRGSFGESRSWNHASAALGLRQKWEPDGSVDVCSITKSWTCETFTCVLTARTLTPFLTAASGAKQYIRENEVRKAQKHLIG